MIHFIEEFVFWAIVLHTDPLMLCFNLYVDFAGMSYCISLSFFFRGPGNLHNITLFVFYNESVTDRTLV